MLGPMARSTPHDFWEIACRSSRDSFPAPTISRSITNLGMVFLLGAQCGAAGTVRLEASVPAGAFPGPGRKSRSARGQAGRRTQAGLAGAHDRLVAMLRSDLVEDTADVVADGLLREPEGRGDLPVVESLGDAFQDVALTRREIAEGEPGGLRTPARP